MEGEGACEDQEMECEGREEPGGTATLFSFGCGDGGNNRSGEVGVQKEAEAE